MTGRLSFFAPCARGIEPLLADELRSLRIGGVRPQRAGVLFAGGVTDAYRVLLWSRLASRVLLSLGEVDATSAESLLAGVTAMPWEDHVRAGGTIAVDAAGTNPALRNTQFTAVRVKDGIADRFRERFGRRPSVDRAAPDLRINVVVRDERAKVALDLASEPLHRRGYREPGVQVEAPLKETLAAAVLECAGWRGIADGGGAFIDPLCGSGTLAIEAALIACDVAPGLLRRVWGFDGWLGHDAVAWAELMAEATERRATGVARGAAIACSDADARAVNVARSCARRAGLETIVTVSQASLADARPPAGASAGLLACNPPYGERLSDRTSLPALYRELAVVVRESFEGYELAVLTSDPGLEAGLGMSATRHADVFNGRIPAKIHVFSAVERAVRGPDTRERNAAERAADQRGSQVCDARPTRNGEDPAFENRLRKMARHHATWARRTGVSCYRVYDADLPGYNVAIDLYQGAGEDEGRRWLHVAEYAPPPDVDPLRATARLEHATVTGAAVLGVEESDVFVKRRERQRGDAQYTRLGSQSVRGTVDEAGLLFEVNFSDYLDTGLFLDHRETRAWLRELASQSRFLNLFAYTGTASVYAAAGGAVSTTSVDLSATYLEWAGRNLARNGFGGDEHALVRADATSWVRDAASSPARYDLIFCDPPTFSNSKRMRETFDVQRDHVDLITDGAALLADSGTMIFSCNRRRFRLDTEALEVHGLAVRDVTRRTIPRDFEHAHGVHACWTVRRT